MVEYVGAVHMHSVFSDGSGKPDEIASFADEVGLDFIILTDHNTLRALDEGYEKWYGNTLMLVGCEINDKQNLNHYIALGIDKTFSTRMPAKEYVARVKQNGGIGFIAHPHEKRSSMKEHPPYPWTEWNCEDFTGIEIWNHMSEWMEGLTEQNKYNYFVHPLRSIVAPPQETLEVWDKLNLKRRVVGIGGVDAHAHKVNLLGFFEVEVFPYKVLFKSIRTHILTKSKISKVNSNVDKAKKTVIDTLGSGNCFISNYYRGDAKGFRFFGENNGKTYNMGENMPISPDSRLKVILPDISGMIKLIKNGITVDEIENLDAEFVITQKGAYRVEVFRDNFPWIYSNHIRIGL
ncbi:MAG: PHP domain-containing protein [Melioribacteraceae bacterium]|nr:PHP domain-containing protein [Melioribacteraceae bacterium]